jgi:cold shock CspA family protein
MFRGTIYRWRSDGYYSFIKRDDGQPDVFAHGRDLYAAGLDCDTGVIGTRVEFDVVVNLRNGKLMAGNVRREETPPMKRTDGERTNGM